MNFKIENVIQLLRRNLIILIIMINCFPSMADMGPKYRESIEIEIRWKENPVTDFDSICAIVIPKWSQDSTNKDTARLIYDTGEYWCNATLNKIYLRYEISSPYEIAYFKLILFKKGVRYESDYFKRYYGNSEYIFDLSDNFKDLSSLFHTSWGKYSGSLFLTLLIEFLIGIFFYLKYRTESFNDGKILVTFLLVNFFTHFSLWFIYSHIYISIFILEITVILTETIFWRKYLKLPIRRSLLISFLTNFASWIFGELFM